MRKSKSCRPKSRASSATSWSITGWNCIASRWTTKNREPRPAVNFDLVIFDCDGVLVDSEVISCRAHAETLTRHGYRITAEQVLERFLGRSMRQATIEVEAELGRSLPHDFASQTYAEIFRLFAASLEATPHISDALAQI